MSESIEVSRIIPASAEAIYKAWLSGPEHGQMTGSTATYNEADDTFTAWEGYISGKTLRKEPFARIVQAWRTTEFLDADPDSELEILLDPQGEGTMVTVRQSNIPDGQGDAYRSGWEEHYFEPMIQYSKSTRAKLNQAGHAVSDAAEAAGDAIGDAAQQVQKSANQAARQVRKTAKKAASAVKKFVAQAKKKLAARKPKGKPSRKAAPKRKAAGKKAAPKKKKVAPKRKAKPAAKKKAAGKKRRG
ncbi:MAG: activator of 90 kDa heat shock protein ATPase 1 [Myxococcaceae bacterium]|nr:activator of 90 kDa heat shock protein ATPase 1 [Myxococcaceae bacterium]